MRNQHYRLVRTKGLPAALLLMLAVSPGRSEPPAADVELRDELSELASHAGIAVPAPLRCDAGLAGHFDLFLAVDGPGSQIRVDVQAAYCRQFLTGHPVIPGNFNDFAGGPYLTDDPGWFMNPGNLLPDEALHFRALDALRFWDPATGRWGQSVPNGEQVRLFGGIPQEVFIEAITTGNLELLAPFEEGTIYTTEGVEGPAEAGVDFADSAGGIHSHLDFCLQDGSGDCPDRQFGTPAAGAYLIQLQFLSPEEFDGAQKYQPSEAVLVALRNGISVAEFQDALDALTDLPPPTDGALQTKLPGAGVLVLTGAQ